VWIGIDRYGIFIIVILLVVINSSALGDQITAGYLALFRALLPAYQ